MASHLQSDFHGSSALQWRTARTIRSPFTPRLVNLYNVSGKLAPKPRRSEVFEEYLSEKVWKAPSDIGPVPVNAPPSTDCGSFFSMGELNIVLRSLRTGRAPGPDGIVSEMLKGSPCILKLFLLDHFHHCLSTSTAPDSWALSEVVMLVKKAQGDTRDLSNYRPISLTNTMYKIFASLIQKRLSSFFDDKIRPTQFGFRANRSTSQPIHIMRRLLESLERQQHPLHLLFLDWSKAFDSVTFESISAALTHFGIPPLFKDSILSLYSNPKFKVRDSGVTSPILSQTRGLRQGCPLSQYLFNLVLTHLFHDVEVAYSNQLGLLAGVLNTPFPLWDPLFSPTHQGSVRGLRLNLLKCAHLKLHSTERIPFSSSCSSPCDCTTCHGQALPQNYVPESDEVKYLGVFIDSLSNNNKNVPYRISQAVTASKLLKLLFGHKSLPPSWKLTVYRSVIQSILLHAMESAQLSPSHLTRINHVHFKSLRRIFGIKSSFYHRVLNPTATECSNTYLAGLAYDTLGVATPTQIYSQNRLALLGHLFRHDDSLEYHATFMSAGRYRHVRRPARAGRPKLHWAEATMTEAMQSHIQSDTAPLHSDIYHSYFQLPTLSQVKQSHSTDSLISIQVALTYCSKSQGMVKAGT